jgi:potassium channel subfamily K
MKSLLPAMWRAEDDAKEKQVHRLQERQKLRRSLGTERRSSLSTSSAVAGTRAAQYMSLDTSSCLSRHALLIVVVYLASSASFFALAEKWLWTDALYFCCVTLLTIGYGDFIPTSNVTKAFIVVYLLIGLSLIATCLGTLFGHLNSALSGQRSDPGKHYHLRQVAWGILGVLLVLGTGTALVCNLEGWTVLDGVYWATVTASATGYGDFVPSTALGRLLCTPYFLCGIGGFALSLSKFGSVVMEIEAERALDRFVRRGVSAEMLAEMGGSDGRVDKVEFLSYMLVHMGKVQQTDLDKVMGMFHVLDVDGDETLGPEDVRRLEAAAPSATAPLPPRPPLPSRKPSQLGEGGSVGGVPSAAAIGTRGATVGELKQPLLRLT